MKRHWYLYGIALVMALGWLMVFMESPGPGYRQFLRVFGLPVAVILLLGWYLAGRAGRHDQPWRRRTPRATGSTPPHVRERRPSGPTPLQT